MPGDSRAEFVDPNLIFLPLDAPPTAPAKAPAPDKGAPSQKSAPAARTIQPAPVPPRPAARPRPGLAAEAKPTAKAPPAPPADADDPNLIFLPADAPAAAPRGLPPRDAGQRQTPSAPRDTPPAREASPPVKPAAAPAAGPAFAADNETIDIAMPSAPDRQTAAAPAPDSSADKPPIQPPPVDSVPVDSAPVDSVPVDRPQPSARPPAAAAGNDAMADALHARASDLAAAASDTAVNEAVTSIRLGEDDDAILAALDNRPARRRPIGDIHALRGHTRREVAIPAAVLLLAGSILAMILISNLAQAGNDRTLGRIQLLYFAADAAGIFFGCLLARMLIGVEFGDLYVGLLKLGALMAVAPAIWTSLLQMFVMFGGPGTLYVAMTTGFFVDLACTFLLLKQFFDLEQFDQVVVTLGVQLIKLVIFLGVFVTASAMNASEFQFQFGLPAINRPRPSGGGVGGGGVAGNGISKMPEVIVPPLLHLPSDNYTPPPPTPQPPREPIERASTPASQLPAPAGPVARAPAPEPALPAPLAPASLPPDLQKRVTQALNDLDDIKRTVGIRALFTAVAPSREALTKLRQAESSLRSATQPGATPADPPLSRQDLMQVRELASALLGATPGRRGAAEEALHDDVRPIGALSPEDSSPVSFRNQVQPILTAMGCNSGACHGSATGAGGFALSLRGYDALHDWQAIARQTQGRRVNLLDPAHSLLLLKAAGQAPHASVAPLAVSSDEYRLLARWIAGGAAGPSENEPRLTGIELSTSACRLQPTQTLALRLVAHYSDGAVADVTNWGKYSASPGTTAAVSPDGTIKALGPGEQTVVAWYQGKLAICRVTVPFAAPLSADIYAAAPRRNLIDPAVLATLSDLSLPPSPRSGDGEFLRRVYLDTVGVLPSPEQARGFLADASANKRDALIESLLARPEFADYWTYHLMRWLRGDAPDLSPTHARALYAWAKQQVASDAPWDQIAAQILSASGNTLESGPANFYLLHDSPEALAENAGRIFMGMNIRCARCHDHPLEQFSNDDYNALENVFARVRIKSDGDAEAATVLLDDQGDLPAALSGRIMPPGAMGVSFPADAPDRRTALRQWLATSAGPLFARAAVNRVWASFFAAPLVDPVDDLRSTNPGPHEQLLSQLAEQLAASKFSLKSLIRLIVQSETYQRTSATAPGNEADRAFFSHAIPRLLPPQVLLDALSQATGAPTIYESYRPGLRAVQIPERLPETAPVTLAPPPAPRSSGCTREQAGSSKGAPYVINAPAIKQKLTAEGGVIAQLEASGATDDQAVRALYLTALSRQPANAELKSALADLQVAPIERSNALGKLYWKLISSDEFVTNH